MIVLHFLNGDSLEIEYTNGVTIQSLSNEVRETKSICRYDGILLTLHDAQKVEDGTEVEDGTHFNVLVLPYTEVLRRAFAEFQSYIGVSYLIGMEMHLFDDTVQFYEEFYPAHTSEDDEDEEDDQALKDRYLDDMYEFRKRLVNLHPLSSEPSSEEDAMTAFVKMYHSLCKLG